MSDSNLNSWEAMLAKHNIHPEILPIAGPPCAQCAHWKPQRKSVSTPRGIEADGLALCHAKQFFHDFSCFDEKNLTP